MPTKKILIVDDDKKVTEGIGVFLSKLGYQMILALDGEKALEIVAEENPALVLLDMQLPKINGTAVLTILRNKFKDTKVFIITGYSKEVKWKCDAIGYDRYFEKPVELDPLIEAIEQAIEGKPVAGVAEILKGIPKAKILSIAPSIIISSYTTGLFHAKEFCKGDYQIREINDYGKILIELQSYHPDVVVMYDYFSVDVINLAVLANSSSFRPKILILHGFFPKSAREIQELERQGIIYCNQNTMTDEELRKSNMKLIDLVGQECLKKDLKK